MKKGYKVAVIGQNELLLGFRLAGIVETFDAQTGAEAEQAIRGILQRDDIGLVIIGSKSWNEIHDRKIINTMDSSILPVFIEIPGYKEAQAPDTLRRLIIRAIGIDISNKNASG